MDDVELVEKYANLSAERLESAESLIADLERAVEGLPGVTWRIDRFGGA